MNSVEPFDDESDGKHRALEPNREWRSRIASHPWVQRFQWLSETGSTNDVVREWLQATRPTRDQRFLCVADRQNAGRGRGTHSWWSPEGCLMFSWSYQGNNRPGTVNSTLALVVGLAAAKVLTRHARVRPKIKWPNDLYLGEKKVGGILIESVAQSQFIIGLGINVQVNWETAPAELKQRATSLHEWCEQAPPREQLLWELLEELRVSLLEWEHQPSSWHAQWLDYCLLHGKHLTIQQGQQSWTGLCMGVANDGSLQVVDSDGMTHQVFAAEVRLIDGMHT